MHTNLSNSAGHKHVHDQLKRAGLWETSRWEGAAGLPSMARMMIDQARPSDCTLDEMEARIAHSYANLY